MADTTNAAPVTPAADITAVPSKTDAVVSTTAPVKVDENGVAPESAKKVWKIKANGKEIEYDASDEAKIRKDLEKVIGIEEKAKTASEKADKADKLVTMLTTDYKGFVKQCKESGIDPQKLAANILYEQIRLNGLTPEQRELEEYKEREKQAAEDKAAAEAESKKTEASRKTQEWAQKFEKDCEVALSTNHIPKTRLSLALIAQYIDSGLAQKQEFTVEQVLPYVARDLKEIHTSTMGKLDGDELLDYVGEALSNKIAKARVARYQKQTTAATAKPSNTAPAKRADDISHLKGKAYWAALRKQKSEMGIGMRPGEQ
jgi:hypothetical protein